MIVWKGNKSLKMKQYLLEELQKQEENQPLHMEKQKLSLEHLQQ